MKNLTHEEILYHLRRIANGDAENTPELLVYELKYLASEIEFGLRSRKIIK